MENLENFNKAPSVYSKWRKGIFIDIISSFKFDICLSSFIFFFFENHKGLVQNLQTVNWAKVCVPISFQKLF